MLKFLALATAVFIASPLAVPQPATAYDPCERATREYRQAARAFRNYCNLSRIPDDFQCASEDHINDRELRRANRLWDEVEFTRRRMARACGG